MSACSNMALLINGTIEAIASPNMASPHAVPFSLKHPPHSDASLFKIDHIEGPALVRLGCPLATEKRTTLLRARVATAQHCPDIRGNHRIPSREPIARPSDAN